MTGAGWEELKALFHGALDQPAEQRREWLLRATTNTGAREQVAALLRAHDTAGSFLETPPEVPVPERIGPYDIEGELGRGGMGIVYLARDTRLHRRVALKAVPAAAAADHALRERLRREARTAAALTHPGIATIYALEEVGGELYIVSEYVGGRTLRDLLAAGPLPAPRAIDIARQVGHALAAAHAAGIVHRDLKPENIVLVDDAGGRDTAKIVDFGIAHVGGTGAADTRRGPLAGTPAYLAPEQLAGRADARSDLYAVGVILGEMLTGAHPLAGGTAAAPPALRAVVSRCLASEPHLRYQSALEFVTDLEHDTSARTHRWPYLWWAFHQAAAVIVYAAMLIPMWSARQLIGGTVGRTIFLAAVAAAVVSSVLRLHRWFASRWYADEFRRVRARTAIPLRASDSIFVLTLLAAGLTVSDGGEAVGVLLISVAAGVAVSFLLIEPATMRAAFAEPRKQS